MDGDGDSDLTPGLDLPPPPPPPPPSPFSDPSHSPQHSGWPFNQPKHQAIITISFEANAGLVCKLPGTSVCLSAAAPGPTVTADDSI